MKTLSADIIKAVRDKYPNAEVKVCYEALVNGKGAEQTERHGFVIDELYFVDSETLNVYEKTQFFLVENIEDALLD